MSSASASTAIATAALSASASATATRAATASATATAFLLGPCFIYNQRSSQKILSVQRLDGFHSFGVVANFSKTKSARLIRKAVPQQRERIGLNSNFREHCRDLLFRSFERQITEIEFLHDRSPWASGQRQSAIKKLKKQDLGSGRPSGDGPHPV